MTIGPLAYAILSGIVFCIGLGGVMIRRQALAQLISLGVAFGAPVIAAAGFSETEGFPSAGANTGVAFAAVVAVSMTAEVAVAAAVLVLLVRRRHTLDLDNVEHLQG